MTNTALTSSLVALLIAGCAGSEQEAGSGLFGCSPRAVLPGTYIYGTVHENGHSVPGVPVRLIQANGSEIHTSTGTDTGDYGCFLQVVDVGNWTFSATKGSKSGAADVQVAHHDFLEVIIRLE